MILNQAALKRQVTVLSLLVIIVIAGIYCYTTLLTLIVVPVLCSLVDSMKKGIDR